MDIAGADVVGDYIKVGNLWTTESYRTVWCERRVACEQAVED